MDAINEFLAEPLRELQRATAECKMKYDVESIEWDIHEEMWMTMPKADVWIPDADKEKGCAK